MHALVGVLLVRLPNASAGDGHTYFRRRSWCRAGPQTDTAVSRSTADNSARSPTDGRDERVA